MDMEIVAGVCIFLFYWKLNQNYSKKIPCFVENEIKTSNKIYGVSKTNMWFSTTKDLQLL